MTVAACPRSGVLRSRGGPFERAARVCRKAGATVQQHVLLRDLNVEPGRPDERRIEVIANGLPLWSRAQVAVDTTLVGRTLSFSLPGSAISLSLASKAVAGGVPKRPPSSACSHAAAFGRCRPLLAQRAPPPSHFVGRPSCPSQPHARLPPASLGFPWPAPAISSRTLLKSHLSPAACPEGPSRWISGLRPLRVAHIDVSCLHWDRGDCLQKSP